MDAQAAAAAASNSSDFVRKLYKMLEDPSYDSVVRWGNEGDSFVVLENEHFTKSILPKHFKHSNFASFVRQLNKYDFHKVRHSNEESGQSQYGVGAWEFKHPDFKMNNKDALDNIRRKAPVPRKHNAPSEEVMPTQQIDLVNTQLGATHQQLQTLQDRYTELSMHHQTLLQEVIGLQKTVVNHEHVIQNVMSFLHTVDSQRRRDSRVATVNPFAQLAENGALGQQNPQPHAQLISPDTLDDAPASPLQNADKLLHDLNANVVLNSRNLEQMNEVAHKMNGASSTPPSSEAAFRSNNGPPSRGAPTSSTFSGARGFGDIDHMVYPVGQTNGIDPTYSEHIRNIPYPLPSKPLDAGEAGEARAAAALPEARKKHNLDPGWIRQPQILLVEDDPTCRRIGGKFLYAFNCAIDSALDGLEAVNKMNTGSKYDLVLMDIIMPNLDGVSACHLIRQFDSTPIIAMTSNIRSDDISMYFQHGMNDVLPKPFTKEGLLICLEKHLSHLLKSSAAALKEEESNNSSPAALSTNWNSPAVPGPSPVASHVSQEDYLHAMRNSGAPNAYMASDSTGPFGQTATSRAAHSGGPGSTTHRRLASEMAGGEDVQAQGKRHQLYPPMQMQGPPGH